MSRRRALLLAILLASTAAARPAVAQDATRPVAPAQDGVRPIAPAQTYRPPAASQGQLGGRLDVPAMGGAAGQSTSGGQRRKAGAQDDQEQDRLRRLDPNALAGGDPNMAGGDYGVEPREQDPLAGGDYGVTPEREAPTATIAPTLLADPLAQGPRSFRNSRLGRLRRLPEPATLTAPGQTDPNDPYAPLGIRAGSFLLRPSIETAAGYDTNPDRLSKSSGEGELQDETSGGKPKGSKYLRTRAELDAQSDWARHELDFRGSAEFRRDLDIKGAGYEPQINAALSGRLDVTERTQVNAELRGSIAAARPGDPETTTGIKGEEITRNAGATLGVAQRFNRFSLRLDGLVDRFTVDDSTLREPVNGSTNVDNRDRAYNQYEVRLRGAYEVSPKLAPFAEIAVDTRDYDLKRSLDDGLKLGSDGWALRSGARFELTRLITGEASVGYGRQTPKDPSLKTVEGLLIDGAVAWAPTALTTFRLSANSALQESSLADVGGVLSRTVEGSVEHRLRRNWTVTGRATFNRGDYQGSNPKRVEDEKTLALETEYRLTRELALTGKFEQVWLDSTIKSDNYKASVVEFGLKFRR